MKMGYISIYLYHLQLLLSVFHSFQYISLIILVKFIPRYLILFDQILSGFIFLISFSNKIINISCSVLSNSLQTHGLYCRVRELEEARFGKRTRPGLYRNRSPLMRPEGAAVRLVSCCTNPRKE